METRLFNIFKTANVTKLTKAILESSYRVLQVTSRWKTLKQPVYFLRAVEFWSTFDIQIDITLAIVKLQFGYSCKTTFSRNPIKVWLTHQKMATCFFIFAKLNGVHPLMANIFKLHKYQTFCLIETHMSKIRFANNKFSL